MELHPFTPNYLPTAVELFLHNFHRLQLSVPALPATLDDEALIESNLRRLLDTHPGVVALDGDRLVGYLTSMVLDNFRNAGRRAAYSPEWGHAAESGCQAQAYRLMYRELAAGWASQGCQVHAITLLAHDPDVLNTWFWNGFGMAVVDAVRPVQPLARQPRTQLSIRRASVADAVALSALELEHRRYYTLSPVFMPLRVGQTEEEFRQFLQMPGNSIWLVLDGEVPVGFLRLDGYECDAADAMVSDGTVMITGAFLQAAYRGRGANTAMLDAALRHHAGLGKTCCAVDFEAFNPDATAFWLRHFQPVCFSLMRMPEVVSQEN
jgi:GNAT superfamily N-acetyltransferase